MSKKKVSNQLGLTQEQRIKRDVKWADVYKSGKKLREIADEAGVSIQCVFYAIGRVSKYGAGNGAGNGKN